MKYINHFITITLLSLLSAVSVAEVNFQGFASFVGGMTLDKDDSNYLGYQDQLEFNKQSLYALQASSDLGEGLSVTAQLIGRGTDGYKPEFEWMYLSYNLTPNLNAKIGRIRTPFYMKSEYLEVGYTYHWIRPPVEAYQAQVTNMDAISLTYNTQLGPVDTSLSVSAGARENFIEPSSDDTIDQADYRPLYTSSAQFEYGPYVGKLLYSQGNITIAGSLDDAVEAAFASDPAFLAEHGVFDESPVKISGIAVDMDFHPILVMLEYSRVDTSESVLGTVNDRFLASLAYTLGENVIHYSYSGNDITGNDDLVSKLANPSGPLAATVALFTAGQVSETATHTLGFRHDFHSSAAAKVELISTETEAAAGDTEATVLRFGVDVLF